MAEEVHYSREKEVARLHNIRRAIDKLAVDVKRGDTNAMERSAHLASSAGKISARIGQYNDAGDYYKYGGNMLRLARGAGAEGQEDFMEALYNKSDRMYRINDKVRRGRRKVLEEHAEEVPAGKYEGAAAMTLIVIMLVGAVALMSPIITGNVVSDISQRVLGVFGLCLFALGLIAGYIYLSKRNS
jgi:hypothetical protein